MNNEIYTILVFEQLEKNDHGFPDFGCQRLVGYYFDKDNAFDAVKNNCLDINESCYDYALIEKVEEGLYRPAIKHERWLFKYDRANCIYKEILEPEFMNHLCGLTIG